MTVANINPAYADLPDFEADVTTFGLSGGPPMTEPAVLHHDITTAPVAEEPLMSQHELHAIADQIVAHAVWRTAPRSKKGKPALLMLMGLQGQLIKPGGSTKLEVALVMAQKYGEAWNQNILHKH